MNLESIIKYYELLRKQNKGNEEIRKRIVRRFRLKFLGDGAYSKVFSKVGFGYVIKFCRGHILPEAHTKTLKRAFIGYFYISKNKKFGIQKKLRVRNYSSNFFRKVHYGGALYFPIEMKFKNMYPRIFDSYDTHYGNLGQDSKGNVFLIDF